MTTTALTQEQISVIIPTMNACVELSDQSGNEKLDKWLNDNAMVVEGIKDDKNRIWRETIKVSQGSVGTVNNAGQVLGDDYGTMAYYEDITNLTEKAAPLRIIHRNRKILEQIYNKVDITNAATMEASVKNLMATNYMQKIMADQNVDLDQTIRNAFVTYMESLHSSTIYGVDYGYRTAAGTVFKSANTVVGTFGEATIDSAEALMYAQVGPKNQEIEWNGAKTVIVKNSLTPVAKKIIKASDYVNRNYANLIQDAEIIPANFSDARAYGFGFNPVVKKIIEAGSRGFYQGSGDEGQINLFYAEIFGFAMLSGLNSWCIKPS